MEKVVNKVYWIKKLQGSIRSFTRDVFGSPRGNLELI
jgi:hypothetical protein